MGPQPVPACYCAPTGNEALVFESPPHTRIKLIPRGHEMWGERKWQGAKGLPSNWDNFIVRVIMAFRLPQGTPDRLRQLQPTAISISKVILKTQPPAIRSLAVHGVFVLWKWSYVATTHIACPQKLLSYLALSRKFADYWFQTWQGTLRAQSVLGVRRVKLFQGFQQFPCWLFHLIECTYSSQLCLY